MRKPFTIEAASFLSPRPKPIPNAKARANTTPVTTIKKVVSAIPKNIPIACRATTTVKITITNFTIDATQLHHFVFVARILSATKSANTTPNIMIRTPAIN